MESVGKMSLFDAVEKMNVPVYVCSDGWKVVYRNRVSKKLMPSPRVNSDFSRIFFDKVNVSFPDDDGDAKLCGCMVKGVYKTAMLLGYRGYALIVFPTVFDFDILFMDLVKKDTAGLPKLFRETLDVLEYKNVPIDRYGIVEKIRKYIFSSIDNYVTLAIFDTDSRVKGGLKTLYDFFGKSAVNTVNRSGYKVEVDSTELVGYEDGIYVDTAYFSMILSNLLLFCLAASADKKCVVKAEFMGLYVRNRISFKCILPEGFVCKNNAVSELMCCCPAEYMNFIPFEELCRSLYWNMEYRISSENELNVSVFFDTDIDTKIIFRSPGDKRIVTAEEVADKIFGKVFSALLK